MSVSPSGRERTFGEDEIIVSKTDRYGKITYVNEVFMQVSGYTEEEVLGAPHSVIRHPDMPRCVFQLAWERILSGHEIFAYVVNLAKSGDHYWVFAHITPTFGPNGEVTGFHSNRRRPDPEPVEVLSGLYKKLAAEEQRFSTKQEGMAAGRAMLDAVLAEKGISYDELMFAITTEGGNGHGHA